MDRLSENHNQRPTGVLPSNTQNNPRVQVNTGQKYQPPPNRNEQVNAISTRSGNVYDSNIGVVGNSSYDSEDEEEEAIQEEENQVEKEKEEPKQTVKTPVAPMKADAPPPYKPKIPFPQRLVKEKIKERVKNFVNHLSKVHINLPFLDAISEIPGFAKCLKQLLVNKKKLAEVSTATLEDVCSAAITGTLPKKRKDPGSFTIPCNIGNLSVNHALADSGASVNLMPYSMYAKLNLGDPKPVRMRIQLADKSIIQPIGILEDVLVKVHGLVFPVDFIIIDVNANAEVPMILGRPFLATADANIEVGRGRMTLRIGEEFVTFSNACLDYDDDDVVETACVVSYFKFQDNERKDDKFVQEDDGIRDKKGTLKSLEGECSKPLEPQEPSAKVRKLYNRVKSAIFNGNSKLTEELWSGLSKREKDELMIVVEKTRKVNDWIKRKSTDSSERTPNTSSVGVFETLPS